MPMKRRIAETTTATAANLNALQQASSVERRRGIEGIVNSAVHRNHITAEDSRYPAYLSHFNNSGSVGRLPYIRMPTR